MNNFYNKYRRGIPVVIIAMMLILAMTVTLSINADPSVPTEKLKEDSSETLPQVQEESYLGVVKEINTQVNAITIMNIEGNSDKVLYFNGGTDIRDRYSKVIAMSQIVPGEMVDVNYQIVDNKLVKMQISDKAWEYQGVSKMKIDNSRRRIEVADSNYQYTEHLVIANGDELAGVIDINNKDELTLKGVGTTVYSIIIAKGHGYVRLVNYEDFIDGTIEVGYDIILPVSQDMLIVAREGDYKLTMEKGGVKGSKHISVNRDKETLVDMSEYKGLVTPVSNVDFLIDPEDAVLMIDGKETDYSDSVEVEYGTHDIKVSLGGYDSYTGVLNVTESSMTIPISLAGQSLKESASGTDKSDDNKKEETESSKDESEEVIGKTPEGEDITLEKDDSEIPAADNSIPKLDSAHKIKVEQPEGAEVYLNGNLKGIVPCSFTKQLGSITISFRRDGYQTKSYTFYVADDDKDLKLSLPSLLPGK